MTVYLDVIWLLNLLFDSLLLYLTAIFLKRKIRIWRLLAGGFIGSMIIILAFTPFGIVTNHPFSKLICSVLMIFAAFGYQRWRYFFKCLMTLYLATFLLGGTLMGTHFFLQYDSNLSTSIVLSTAQGFGDPISWMFVLLGFPIAWHFSKSNIEGLEMVKIQYEQIVDVSVLINEDTLCFKGLVDSGNQLYDPISKMPVMFISIKQQMEKVGEPIKKLASHGEAVILGSIELPDEWHSRLRVVPYSVVGQERQMIAAIKPDKIFIYRDNDQYLCEKGLIAFTMQELSGDQAFDCIVHPKMLTGPKSIGSIKVS